MIMFVDPDETIKKIFSPKYFLSEKFFLVSVQSQQKFLPDLSLMKDNIYLTVYYQKVYSIYSSFSFKEQFVNNLEKEINITKINSSAGVF